MIILDSNVVSALMQTVPDKTVAEWLDRQPRDSVWITSVTVMELRFGLQTMPASRRRDSLSKALAVLLEEKIQGRVAPFDSDAAEKAGELMASRKLKGRRIEIRDSMIAGIVMSTHGILVTRNTAHFSELDSRLVNPWVSQG